MAGILNKIKGAIGGETAAHDSTNQHTSSSGYSTAGNTVSTSGSAPNTSGPHSTDAANRVDPRIDSDGDGRAGYETGDKYSGVRSGATGMGSGVGHPDTGVGKNSASTPIFGGGKDKDNHLGHTETSDLERYEQRHGHTAGVSAVEGLAGREASHHSGTTGSSTLGSAAHTSGSGVGYGQNTTSSTGTSGYGSTTSGSTGNYGAGYSDNTSGTNYGSSTTTGTSGNNYGSSTTTGTSGSTGSTASNLLNKLNPLSGSSTTGNTTSSGTTGTTGEYSTSSTGGYEHAYPGLHAKDVVTELKGDVQAAALPHHRNNLYMSDKLEDYETGSGRHTVGDPNYGLNSSRGTTGTTGTTGTGYGSSTTAGPHSSNLENKLDPRVDSDQDGSRLR